MQSNRKFTRTKNPDQPQQLEIALQKALAKAAKERPKTTSTFDKALNQLGYHHY